MCAGNVDRGWIVGKLALELVHAHVAHEEDEADPWHVGASAEEEGDGVGATRGKEDGSQAIPEIEQADEVENADSV